MSNTTPPPPTPPPETPPQPGSLIDAPADKGQWVVGMTYLVPAEHEGVPVTAAMAVALIRAGYVQDSLVSGLRFVDPQRTVTQQT